MVITNNIPTHPEGKTMKAVCFSSFGKIQKKVLEVKTIPRPFIISGDGDDGTTTTTQLLLIKVHACALNPIDKIRLNGDLAAVKPEQFTDNNVLGYDVSGVIEEITLSSPSSPSSSSS